MGLYGRGDLVKPSILDLGIRYLLSHEKRAIAFLWPTTYSQVLGNGEQVSHENDKYLIAGSAGFEVNVEVGGG